jgi:hypothetical protein
VDIFQDGLMLRLGHARSLRFYMPLHRSAFRLHKGELVDAGIHVRQGP